MSGDKIVLNGDMNETWVICHKMDSQQYPEKIAVVDVPRSPMDLDDLVAELRMKPGVDIPSVAPGDTLHVLDVEEFEFRKGRGEVTEVEPR